MAKVVLAKVVEAIHGRIGDMVFRNEDGHQSVFGTPDYSERIEPPEFKQQQSVMARAGLWWRSVKVTNPTLMAAYAARAKELRRRVFSIVYADYCDAPRIEEIDCATYSGRAGQKITVHAVDHFPVSQVQVVIRASGGEIVESGVAAKADSAGAWFAYLTTTDLVTVSGATVEAIALDWPGNRSTRAQILGENATTAAG